METPSVAHILYITCAVALGFYVGWVVGTRNVRNEWARAERRRKAEAEREADR